MADYDPFGEYESRPEEPTGEDIPLTPRGGMVTTHVKVHVESGERETPFGGLSDVRARLEEGFKRDKVDELYEILSKEFPKNQDVIYYDDFVVSREELYFKGKENKPLTIKGHLRLIGTLKRVLGKNRIYNLGFNISK